MLMDTLSSSEYCLSDLADFPNPALGRRRSTPDVVQATMRTVQFAGIPGARWLINQFSEEVPPYFQFHKRREGGKHAVIMVNGFLTRGDLDVSDWEDSILRQFRRATWYHLDWEAGRDPASRLRHAMTIDGLLERACGEGEPDALTLWHSTMAGAERAGELLARAISATPDWRYTLVGHSLGARVIHFALKELAGRKRKQIENAYLLGGAVGGGAKDSACWEAAVSAVKGNIYNCYSGGDTTLRLLYQGANAKLSEPIGYSGIRLSHPRIIAHDASAQVHGHKQWKQHFGEILTYLHG